MKDTAIADCGAVCWRQHSMQVVSQSPTSSSAEGDYSAVAGADVGCMQCEKVNSLSARKPPACGRQTSCMLHGHKRMQSLLLACQVT